MLAQNFELATEYLYAWFEQGISLAERLGYRVVDLPGEAFTKDNLFDALERYRFNAIFLGGHGNPTTLTAQDYEEVLKSCVNDDVCSGNIAYFCSCFTAQALGPSMIEKKTLAYFGSMSDFRFMVDTSYPILDDPLAEPFKDIVVEIMSRILLGQKIIDVWNGTIDKCNALIERLKPLPETHWSDVIGCIEHNRDGFIALGDQEVYAVSPVGRPLIPMVSSLGVGSILTYLTTII